LEFGKKLVAEYGLSREVDTLGRWMAHHIAELIGEAESASAGDQDGKTRAAMDAILNFFDHRATLRIIDPLLELQPLLRVVKSLDLEENQWTRLFRERDHGIVADVFLALRDVLVTEILRRSEHQIQFTKPSSFINDEERALIDAVNLWLAESQKQSLQTSPLSPKQGKETFDARAYTLQKIDVARSALNALEAEVLGHAKKKPNNLSALLSLQAGEGVLEQTTGKGRRKKPTM
jgi:hypothetical protein